MTPIFLIAAALACPAAAQDGLQRPGLSLYGVSGYVEMPSALSQPDGTLSFSTNYRDGVLRNMLTFQITPRLSGVFRYSYFDDFLISGESLYDRSFDVRYLILSQNGLVPALAVGLQDFGGTGIFGGEYLVASRQFSPRLTASAGIGWGRLGTEGSFANPLRFIDDRFRRRPGFTDISQTGRVSADRFFRGDAALFAALDWQATDRLRLALEYSSDAQTQEVARQGFDYRTPLNIAAQYRLGSGGEVGLALLHGSAVTLSYSYSLDPARPRFPSGRDTAPPPVVPRGSAAAASWGLMPGAAQGGSQTATLRSALQDQGLELEGLDIRGDTVTASIGNPTFGAGAQAIGRSARILTAHMPPGVEIFRIRPSENGMALSEVVIRRSDLEELEFAPDNAWQSYVRAQLTDAAGAPLSVAERAYPAFDYRLTPYFSPSVFDPDSAVRADLGAQAAVDWAPARGLVFSAAVRKRVIGNRDQVTRRSNSVLPRVRSDSALYDINGDPEISYLTAEYFFRPGENLYGRATAGYLERMYGGVSAEVLWKPVDSRLGLGVEANYARQRDFDLMFGFQDYDVFTGHASAYYDLGGGFIGQIDAGRYLAGDVGATFALERTFGNGFRLGAFFTLTDVSFDDFGEGSFDKGIRIGVPLTWLAGEPSRSGFGTTIRPVQRDGGARLAVRNRLYGLVRDYHEPEIGRRWGRFWR